MSAEPILERGYRYEGYAFTFCKAAFLVLIFRQYSLLALSGLATLYYLLAVASGVKRYRCWAKPPWVIVFWGIVFAEEVWRLLALAGHAPMLAVWR